MTVYVNASALEGFLRSATTRVAGATAEGVALGAQVYERAIKDEIVGSHGRGTPGSRPGQSPESVSGRLRSSVTISKVRRYGLRFEVEIGPTIFYGRMLERGTKKMEPRPFVSKAADKVEASGAAHELIVAAWRRALT